MSLKGTTRKDWEKWRLNIMNQIIICGKANRMAICSSTKGGGSRLFGTYTTCQHSLSMLNILYIVLGNNDSSVTSG